MREDEVGAEQPRLLSGAPSAVVTADTPGETGHIPDTRARAGLTPGDAALQDDGVQTVRRRVDRGRQARGSGSYDRHVVHALAEPCAPAERLDDSAVRRVHENAAVVPGDDWD